MTTAINLCELIGSCAFRTSNEGQLQWALSQVLWNAGINFLQEHRLSEKDRPDFFINGIVIECKVAGSNSEVLRQLDRYASYDEVKEIILVTTRSKHRSIECAPLRGKEIKVIWVGAFSL